MVPAWCPFPEGPNGRNPGFVAKTYERKIYEMRLVSRVSGVSPRHTAPKRRSLPGYPRQHRLILRGDRGFWRPFPLVSGGTGKPINVRASLDPKTVAFFGVFGAFFEAMYVLVYYPKL